MEEAVEDQVCCQCLSIVKSEMNYRIQWSLLAGLYVYIVCLHCISTLQNWKDFPGNQQRSMHFYVILLSLLVNYLLKEHTHAFKRVL